MPVTMALSVVWAVAGRNEIFAETESVCDTVLEGNGVVGDNPCLSFITTVLHILMIFGRNGDSS